MNGNKAVLSRKDVERYRRDGDLPGRRILSMAGAERFRDDCLRSCAKPIELGDQNPYSLKRHASNRVKPYLLFPWAAELVRHPRIFDLVEKVIGQTFWCFTPPSGSKRRTARTTFPGTRTPLRHGFH